MRHALEQPVRVALDHRAVHERARVALVGVADQVFLLGAACRGRTCHFLPVGKPPPPRPRSPLASTVVADLLGRLPRERAGEGPVAAAGDVFVDARRVDEAAVGQHPAGLRGEERMLVEVGHVGPGLRPSPRCWPSDLLVGTLSPARTAIQQLRHHLGGHAAETRRACGRAAGRPRSARPSRGRCSRPRRRRPRSWIRRGQCGRPPASAPAAGAQPHVPVPDEDGRAVEPRGGASADVLFAQRSRVAVGRSVVARPSRRATRRACTVRRRPEPRLPLVQATSGCSCSAAFFRYNFEDRRNLLRRHAGVETRR